MKAIDSVTGQFKEVYVKALDSLPVGSEIDFDGDTSDIPAGWEQVGDNPKLLWTNPNPSTAISSDTTITLNSSDYDVLEFIFKVSTGDNFQMSAKCVKGSDCRIMTTTSQGVNFRNITRNSDTSFTISANYGPTLDASRTIPLYIIGYKTGLFN